MKPNKYKVISVRYNDIYKYYITRAENKSGNHMQLVTLNKPDHSIGDILTIKKKGN